LEKVLTNYNKNLKDASEDKQIKLAKIDIDQLGELSGQYDVQAVPTGNLRGSTIVTDLLRLHEINCTVSAVCLLMSVGGQLLSLGEIRDNPYRSESVDSLNSFP
jgi:hypothetical protein